jgi:hypothetical protein
MKLKYFRQHGWTKAWVDTAKEIVKEEFDKYKVPHATAAASVSPSHCLLCAFAYIFNPI